jgi:hypothetical protein
MKKFPIYGEKNVPNHQPVYVLWNIPYKIDGWFPMKHMKLARFKAKNQSYSYGGKPFRLNIGGLKTKHVIVL